MNFSEVELRVRKVRCRSRVWGWKKSLTIFADRTGEKLGAANFNLDNTACKVPFAPDTIDKVAKRGAIGKKRKTVKC